MNFSNRTAGVLVVGPQSAGAVTAAPASAARTHSTASRNADTESAAFCALFGTPTGVALIAGLIMVFMLGLKLARLKYRAAGGGCGRGAGTVPHLFLRISTNKHGAWTLRVLLLRLGTGLLHSSDKDKNKWRQARAYHNLFVG